MARRRQRGMPNVTAGLIALGVIVVICYFGFTKAIPFRHHYTVHAVFRSANNIRPDSPVRIAGVNVGKVTGVRHVGGGGQAAVVTMRIDKSDLLRKDATFKVRPRIFLEGNFFVDVDPGSPTAPRLPDGDTVPINQTSAPVQLDEVLTSLPQDTRRQLSTLLEEYGSALSDGGATGWNRSIPYWEPAYKGSAIVNDATLGEAPQDLSGYIRDAGTVASALDRDPAALKSLISDFQVTAGAFARESTALEAAVGELPRTLHSAMPALAALDEAFPPLRRLVHDLRPAVRSSGPTLKAATPLAFQLRKLLSEPEAGGLVKDLKPLVPALTELNKRSLPLYEQVRLAASCQNEVIIPWSQDKIEDTTFPAKGKVYEESVKFLPGIGSESRSGDANGQWFRVLASNGQFAYSLGGGLFTNVASPLLGVNPPPMKQRPPLEPNVPCETQKPPTLRTLPGPPPQQVQTSMSSPAAQARYKRARQEAIDFLRRQISLTGLTKQWRVSDVDATEKTIAIVRALAQRAQAQVKKAVGG